MCKCSFYNHGLVDFKNVLVLLFGDEKVFVLTTLKSDNDFTLLEF